MGFCDFLKLRGEGKCSIIECRQRRGKACHSYLKKGIVYKERKGGGNTFARSEERKKGKERSVFYSAWEDPRLHQRALSRLKKKRLLGPIRVLGRSNPMRWIAWEKEVLLLSLLPHKGSWVQGKSASIWIGREKKKRLNAFATFGGNQWSGERKTPRASVWKREGEEAPPCHRDKERDLSPLVTERGGKAGQKSLLSLNAQRGRSEDMWFIGDAFMFPT